MESISSLLPQKLPKKTTFHHEWQDFAWKVWEAYSRDKKELANLFRFVKQNFSTHRGALESAFSFCFDYTGNVPPLKLFYWRYWWIVKGKN